MASNYRNYTIRGTKGEKSKPSAGDRLLHDEAQEAHAVQLQLRAEWYERNAPDSPYRPVAA